MSEDRPLPILDGTVVWPTSEEVTAGLANLQRCAERWKAAKGLFLEKPYLALLVSLTTIEYDQRHFQLSLRIDDAILAPPDFDAAKPLELTCVWNQPYLSVSSTGISAPYCFYLRFSSRPQEQLAKFRSTKFFDELKAKDGGSWLFPFIRSCFTNPEAFASTMAQISGDNPSH